MFAKHIRHLFTEQTTRKTQKWHLASIVSFPLEILQAIVSELSQSDLSAFIRTNRRFYLLLTNQLYLYNITHFRGSALGYGAANGISKQYNTRYNKASFLKKAINACQTVLAIPIIFF